MSPLFAIFAASMYKIVYGSLYLVSLLPLRLLYLVSDLIYGLIFYVFKYRRDVVFKNLKGAFPEKTDEERMRIAKEFYRNLIDSFVETIKMISASPRFLEKRVDGNWEIINELKPTGKSVQLHLGHNFNWEWANAVGSRHLKFPFLGVYMPLTSKVMDRLMFNLRSRGGTKMLRATHMGEEMIPYRQKQYLLGLVADQNPGHPGNAWWFNFLNQPTPFVKGPARAAKANDTIIVFAFINRVRRGYYKAVMSVAERDPTILSEIEITRRFVRYLENVIHQYPAMWLWSHRRWKHAWKEEYGEINN